MSLTDYKVPFRSEAFIAELAMKCVHLGTVPGTSRVDLNVLLNELEAHGVESFVQIRGMKRKGQLTIEMLDDDAEKAPAHVEFKPVLKLCVQRSIWERYKKGYSEERVIIAHEVGHILLHNDEAKRFSRDPDLQINFADDEDSAEGQANLFADHLLMPTPLVQRLQDVDLVAFTCKPRFTKIIRANIENSFEYKEERARALIARLNLTELYEFLLDPNGKDFDERLVAQNVRYFLGSSVPVNREIRDTLVSGRSSEFSLLNNGMTIVCDQMIMVAGGCFPIKLVNPQIVNGGQTAVVIHSVGTSPPRNFFEGSINIKFVETSDKELIERIAIGSNTQNRIFGRDLRANDDIQLRLASSLSAHGYFYRRKRGEQPPQQRMRIIDAIRVGQFILAYANAEPAKAKTGTNDIFGDLYEVIFNPNKISADLIKAAYVCFERIQDRKRTALAYQRQISRRSFDEAWIIEGAFHVLFVAGELVRRKGLDLSHADAALNEVDFAFDIVQQFVQRNPRTSAYRLFRLISSKEHLLALIPDIHGRPAVPHQMLLPL